MMMTSKTHNYECCMCGDHGLSHELFRCKVCHFRSQHRYCSNLYPKAESYRVCNWCLIQKQDNLTSTTTTTTVISNNGPNSSSPAEKHKNNNGKLYNNLGGPKAGPGPKGLQPTSPIKKPMMRSPEARSPSGRKRITAVNNCPAKKDNIDRLRRTKSSSEMSNYSSSSSRSSGREGGSGGGGGGGAPVVTKHVFRNKVRRYKLLDEVSS